jgi:hypothetical protein
MQTVTMPSKYEPLRRYLEERPSDEPVLMTMDEIAFIVGPLPPSSSTRQWWANTAASLQAKAWLGVGRRVSEVSLGHAVAFSPAADDATISPRSLSFGPSRSKGRAVVMDGRDAILTVLRRAGYDSTLHAVAAHALFLHPGTVAQTGGQPLFPVIRDPNRRGELTVIGERKFYFDDNTSPTLSFLWSAGRRKGPDNQYNHVFGDPRNPDTYTALWNICVTPAFLAKTTDGSNHPEVRAALRFRVVDLYGFWPKGEVSPQKPDGYDTLTWADPPASIPDLEAELRLRMRANSRSQPARAARDVGWLFSDWQPDPTI